jgi:threonine/homoserine/homoserine lactone efflux protein
LPLYSAGKSIIGEGLVAFEIVIALAIFVATTSITPGPNNTMIFASGVNFGFLRSIPHILGISIGFLLLLLAVGIGLSAVITALPWLFTLIKILGALYLCWMAWKIATTRSLNNGQNTGHRPMTFLAAAAFQWVNPKAWVMAVSATATYTNPLHFGQTLAVVALTIAWAAGGTALRGWLSDPVKLKYFNITMGVLLVLSLWPMIR